MEKALTVTQQCHGDVKLTARSNAVFHMSSIFHGCLFTTTVTGVGYGNSPSDLARLILELASGGGTEPTTQEIDSVAQVIVGIHHIARPVGLFGHGNGVTGRSACLCPGECWGEIWHSRSAVGQCSGGENGWNRGSSTLQRYRKIDEVTGLSPRVPHPHPPSIDGSAGDDRHGQGGGIHKCGSGVRVHERIAVGRVCDLNSGT